MPKNDWEFSEFLVRQEPTSELFVSISGLLLGVGGHME